MKCPFHHDKRPSAFLSNRNIFYCSICTPDGGMTAKVFAARLNVDFTQVLNELQPRAKRRKRDDKVEFSPADAVAIWDVARGKLINELRGTDSRPALAFMEGRNLAAALERGVAGEIEPNDPVPSAVSRWAQNGYRVVAPLWDKLGVIANVQARSINGREPKTMNPRGSRVKGTLFANTLGLAILRNQQVDSSIVILGEGLTDFCSLSIATSLPVFSAPGTPFVVPAIGEWVNGRDVVLALDMDEAADNVRPAAAQMAYRFGAKNVRSMKWPPGCKDACDVLAQLGLDGFKCFLQQRIERYQVLETPSES